MQVGRLKKPHLWPSSGAGGGDGGSRKAGWEAGETQVVKIHSLDHLVYEAS